MGTATEITNRQLRAELLYLIKGRACRPGLAALRAAGLRPCGPVPAPSEAAGGDEGWLIHKEGQHLIDPEGHEEPLRPHR